MSLRKWAILLGGVFLLGSVGLFLSRDFLQAGDRIKELVQQEAGGTVIEKLDFNAIETGFGYLSLKNFSLPLNDNADSLAIDELRLGWSIFEIVKYRLNPTKGITSISLINPIFIVGGNPGDNRETGKSFSFEERRDLILTQFEESFSSILQNFKNVTRIEFSGGELFFRKNGELIPIVRNLDGKLSSADKKNAFLFASAELFESNDENVHINANLDLERKSIAMDVEVDDYDLGEKISYLEQDFINVRGGELFVRLQLIKDANKQGEYSFFVNGSFGIKDFEYDIAVRDTFIAFEEATIEGNVEENTITINKYSQAVGDGEVEISGTLLNLFKPEYNLSIRATSLNPDILVSSGLIPDGKNITGSILGDMNLSGNLTKPILSGYLLSDSLTFENMTVEQCSASVTFKIPEDLVISAVADVRQMKMNIDLEWNRSRNDTISITAELDGDPFSLIDQPLPFENRYKSNFRMEIEGPVNNLQGNGNVVLVSSSDEKDIQYQGTFSTGAAGFEAEIGSVNDSDERPMAIDAFLSRDFSQFSLDIMNALTFLQHDLRIDTDKVLSEKSSLDLSMNGGSGSTAIFATAYGAENDTLFYLDGIYNIGREDSGILESNITIPIEPGRNLDVFVDVSKSGRDYKVRRIDIPGILGGSLQITRNDEIELDGTLDISGRIREINDRFADFVFDDGLITGEVSVKGPIESPVITGSLFLNEGRIDLLDDINGTVQFEAENWTEYSVKDILFSYKQDTIARGIAWFDAEENHAMVTIGADSVDSYILNYIIPGDRDYFFGPLTYNVLYEKSNGSGEISGGMTIPEGKFERFNIRNLSVTFDPSMNGGNDTGRPAGFLPDGLWIENASFSNPYNLDVSASGYLSLKNDNESDLNISLNGDILSIFTDIDGFFVETGGTGNAEINLAGSLTRPYVSTGILDIKDGYLEFNKIMKKVENITFNAALTPDSRMIAFNDLSAVVDGKPVEIHNTGEAAYEVNGQVVELEPFELMEDGLNMGVMTLHTGAEGIDINIPGVIENGETGNCILTGFASGEPFFFAGPVEMPHIRGILYLSDSRITFPELEFFEESDDDLNIVERFLYRTNWDVQVKPISNNYYIRDEPISLIPVLANIGGDIYIQLKIDDEEEGLIFRGTMDEEDEFEFSVSGDVQSTRGRIELLNEIFRVEKFESEFSENEIFPVVSGRAKTTIRNRQGIGDTPIDVFITLYSLDENGRKIYSGTWIDDEPNFLYELTVDQNVTNFAMDRTGSTVGQSAPGTSQYYTNEKILELFGYSPDNVSEKVTELAVDRVENALLDPILTPLNRSIRRASGLDEFYIRLNIAKNFAQQRWEPQYLNEGRKFYDLFMTPELNLGKYLFSDLYFMYRGQLVRKMNETEDLMGLNHIVGFEYQMKDQLYFEIQYDYDYYRTFDRGDTRFWLRHQIQLKGIKEQN